MDKTTHEIRIANWRSIIEQCQARPEGQSAKQWLADNGISEKTYYYWQRKVQQEAYALVKQEAVPPAIPISDTQSVTFTEIPYAECRKCWSIPYTQAGCRPKNRLCLRKE